MLSSITDDESEDDNDDHDFERELEQKSYEDLLKDFGKIWIEATVRHNISIDGAAYLWRTTFKWIEKILQKKKDSDNSRKHPQFKHLRRKIIADCLPPVKIRMAYLNLESNTEEYLPPSETGPHRAYSDVSKYQKLYEITSVSVRDVLNIHSNNCRGHQKYQDGPMEVVLSCDGVADSNSSNVSLDVFSISFPECSNIYPITTIRPTKKSSVDFKAEVTKILQEMREENVIIKNVSADKPMRSLLKNCKGHGAYQSCEYCRSTAEYFQDPVSKELFQRHLEKSAKLKDELNKEIERLRKKEGTSQGMKTAETRIRNLKRKIKQEDSDICELKKKISKKVMNGIYKHVI